MNKTVLGFSVGAIVAATLAISPATAQQQTTRLVGTISGMDGNVIVVKQRNGNEVRVVLSDSVAVSGVVRKSLADIKPNDFLGIGGIPQPDGSQKAVRISIFAEAQRGTNEGFGPWSGAPNGTMTNATVDTVVTGNDGHVLTVKYKGGEKTITVTPETQITTNVPGDKSEIKVGANVAMAGAVQKPDGTYESSRINVGRDGIIPQ